jgi:hypothetical protein
MKYDLLLTGGEVVDPAAGLRGVMDIGIATGRMIVRRRAAEERQRCDQPYEKFATAARRQDSPRKTKHPQEAPHSSGVKPIVGSPMHHATSPPIPKTGIPLVSGTTSNLG